jgi:hypothetical protein
MRTYSRQAFEEARELWKDYGWQWNRVRELAASRGFIYPPSGSRHDDRDAAEPSQRAIIWRALEEQPTELYAIVGRSSSWFDVTDRIIGLEARLREDANYSEKDAALSKDEQPNEHESLQSLASIVGRIADSLPGRSA